MKTKDYLKTFLDIQYNLFFKDGNTVSLKKIVFMYLIISTCMINTISAADIFQQDPVIVTGKVVDA
jgi:hypothetical protein